jgi:hypothetical protein
VEKNGSLLRGGSMHSINPFYKKKEILAALQKAFKQEGSVAIGEVLMPEVWKKLRQEQNWIRRTIPDRYNYEEHTAFPMQRELRSFARRITGSTPVPEKNRRFSHRSYTLLHDKELRKPGVVALLFLDSWNEAWGGKIVFMKNGKTLEEFMPRANTLLIVKRDKNTQYFVKYVNHHAKGKFTIISA